MSTTNHAPTTTYLPTLRVWWCNDHTTVWPVGAASVVLAYTEDEARKLLRAKLLERGLPDEPFTLHLMPQEPGAVIICDGNY